MKSMRAIWGGALALLMVAGLAVWPVLAEGVTAAPRQPVRAAAKPAAATNWTGCWVGVSAGVAVMDVGTNWTAPVVGTLISQDGLGASGGVLSPAVGCDLQVQRFVVGAFADYGRFYSVDWKMSVLPGMNALAITTGLDHQWSIGGRFGYLLNDKLLAYGLVAWTELDMNAIGVTGLIANKSFALPTFKGWSIGGGLETIVAPGLSLKAEYRWLDSNSQTIGITPAPFATNLSVDPSAHTFTVGLAYKFPGLFAR